MIAGSETKWTPQGDLTTYVIVDDSLTIPPDHTWTVSPGVSVLFDFGLGAVIQGTLDARGTTDQPVTFGSAGLYSHPLPGDWKGLSFESGGKGSFDHAQVEFAETGIANAGGDITLANSTIAASRTDGIHLRSGTLALSHMSFAGNGQGAGGGFAIRNDSATPIDASGAWWGSSEGPATSAKPDTGGDRVAGRLTFADWLTRPQSPASPDLTEPWAVAPVLNPGSHADIGSIDAPQDYRWFRVPMGTRNATLAATLTGLAQDFDLFMFHGLQRGPSSPEGVGPSSPEGIGPTSPEGIGAGELAALDATGGGSGSACGVGYLGELVRLGIASNTGQLVQSSCRFGSETERVAADAWDQSGWYHLLVAPHNGTSDATRPFTLNVNVVPGSTGTAGGFAAPAFVPLDVAPETRTLLIMPSPRLEARFGRDRVRALAASIDTLRRHPTVAGSVLDLGDFPAIVAAYQAWDRQPGDPVAANRVAASIKALILAHAAAAPNMDHIVLLGDDDAIPFHRIPDETLLSNERTYGTQGFRTAAPALAAGLDEGFFFSDDPYGGHEGIPFRGRELPLSRYGVGRLVETPEEMIAAVDSYLRQPVIDASGGLVTGYDFLTDMAQGMVARLESSGMPPDRIATLINDRWTPADLLNLWGDGQYALRALNAHFTHRTAEAARPDPGGRSVIRPEDFAAGAGPDLGGTLTFSVGCHSGLSVPELGRSDQALDFAQVVVGRGGAYVANTGFGYGDGDAVAYSERLMQLLLDNILAGDSTGDALRRAKAMYLNNLGLRSMTPYDEKVLGQATLYGLPMVRVQVPAARPAGGHVIGQDEALSTHDRATASADLGALSPCRDGPGALCASVRLIPRYEEVRPGNGLVGAYHTIAGESQSIPGRPIQPRTSISVTAEALVARGALFEGGRYRTIAPFDPVITRVITDSSAIDLWRNEPGFEAPGWTNTGWALLNTVGIGEGRQQRLVVTPAQYRPLDGRTGILRQMEALTYTLYYSNHADTLPPSVWSVQGGTLPQDSTLAVRATDFSGVIRIAASFTDGRGVWRTADLTRGADDVWRVALPPVRGLEYFVQAVDGVGNVATNDNKGHYFTLAQRQAWLPWIGNAAPRD